MNDLLENPRDVTTIEIAEVWKEDEFESFLEHPDISKLPEILHGEAIEFMENIGINVREPSEKLKWQPEINDFSRGEGDFSGTYKTSLDVAALKPENPWSKPFSTAVHELFHVTQYKNSLDVNFDKTPEEIVSDKGLSDKTDYSKHPRYDTDDIAYSESPFLENLVSETGLSKTEIAKALQSKEQGSELQNLKNKYDEEVESPQGRLVREMEHELEENEGELDNYPEDSVDQAMSILEDAYHSVEKALEETPATRFHSPRISVELEGFAHYLSAIVEGKDFEYRSDCLDSNYERELDSGETVGDKASDRLDELTEIHDNLTEYGDMDDDEATKYILEEVQEKKLEYADKVNPEPDF